MPNFEHYRNNLLEKGIKNNEQLCEKLLEQTGVALLPGSAFGLPPSSLTARLSYVDFDGQKALDLANTNFDESSSKDQFITTIAGNMIEGIDQLNNWLINEK